MESLSENTDGNKIEDEILSDNYFKKEINNEKASKIEKKLDDLDFDLNLNGEKDSNFLLNSEFIKLTKDEIKDFHLDLDLLSETNTKSYLNNNKRNSF